MSDRTALSRGGLEHRAQAVCDALEHAPHGLAVLSLDGRVVAANGTLRRWAGDDERGALQGYCLSRQGELAAGLQRVADGEAVSFETTEFELVPDVRGTFSVQLSPWTGDRAVLGACLFVYDLTNERATERGPDFSFRQLLDGAPDAMLVVRGSIVLYVNRAARTLLEYDWPEELVGQNLNEILVRGEGDFAGDGPGRVWLRTRSGNTIPAQATRSDLVVDDSAVAVFGLRGVEPSAASTPSQRELLQRLRRELRDLGEALRRAQVRAAVNDPVRRDLHTAERAEQGAVDICRELVAIMGGSRPALRSAEPPATGSAPDDVPADANRALVLVCDDETRLAMLTAGLLEQHGYDAVTVATGAEALEALAAEHFEVVLLDMNLPDGSADEIIPQLEKRGDRVPVILTSGYAEEDVDPKLLAHELVSSYLAKPYSVDRLVGAIREAVDSPSSVK